MAKNGEPKVVHIGEVRRAIPVKSSACKNSRDRFLNLDTVLATKTGRLVSDLLDAFGPDAYL